MRPKSLTKISYTSRTPINVTFKLSFHEYGYFLLICNQKLFDGVIFVLFKSSFQHEFSDLWLNIDSYRLNSGTTVK